MRINRESFVWSVGVALGLGSGGPATAGDHEHGGDYGLVVVDGRVVTGVGDHDEQTVSDLGTRVFGADMALSGPFWAADEPGVFIPAGSMPDGVGVGFVLEAALRRWDGAGAVDFSTVPAQTMAVEFGPLSVSTALTDADVFGFPITYDATNPDGFDEHWDFLLDAAAGTGIYLLQLRFTVDGFQDSESVWTVFNAGLDETAHDAAIEYVEHALVPAPGVLALMGLGGLAATRRRR
jgi:hypothetical protein